MKLASGLLVYFCANGISAAPFPAADSKSQERELAWYQNMLELMLNNDNYGDLSRTMPSANPFQKRQINLGYGPSMYRPMGNSIFKRNADLDGIVWGDRMKRANMAAEGYVPSASSGSEDPSEASDWWDWANQGRFSGSAEKRALDENWWNWANQGRFSGAKERRSQDWSSEYDPYRAQDESLFNLNHKRNVDSKEIEGEMEKRAYGNSRSHETPFMSAAPVSMTYAGFW